MTKIFIEAKHNKTAEYHFLKAILDIYFTDKNVKFIFMDGIGNLFNEVNVNDMSQMQISGERFIVLADADTEEKKQGFEKRKQDIEDGMKIHNVHFPFFLYPDNHGNGDVEMLMEASAQRELHSVLFDCFEDYERCVSGVKDSSGQPLYNVPNRKGKLHTYMNAQRLSARLRHRFGSGDWLFDNKNFWNLEVPDLEPLKRFLEINLE